MIQNQIVPQCTQSLVNQLSDSLSVLEVDVAREKQLLTSLKEKFDLIQETQKSYNSSLNNVEMQVALLPALQSSISDLAQVNNEQKETIKLLLLQKISTAKQHHT